MTLHAVDLAALAARTVSGRRPPTGFLITLWALTVLALGAAVWAIVYSIILRRRAARTTDRDENAGRRGQAGCLMVFAIPCLLLGLFLLSWAVGVSD